MKWTLASIMILGIGGERMNNIATEIIIVVCIILTPILFTGGLDDE